MPDDLTVSTVLRCLDGATRRHLEMVMDDGMDYAKLKDKLILLDKNTKAWSGDIFLKNLQVFNQLSSSSSTYQGPAPMEVDQVQYGNKGKSKGKSKSKGKKGGWFGFPYAGGGHKGSNKGKSKQKGKKGNKGKSKGTHQKGKGYSSGNNNTCRICGEYGHWGNECPLKSRVNQVAGAGAVSSEPHPSRAESIRLLVLVLFLQNPKVKEFQLMQLARLGLCPQDARAQVQQLPVLCPLLPSLCAW